MMDFALLPSTASGSRYCLGCDDARGWLPGEGGGPGRAGIGQRPRFSPNRYGGPERATGTPIAPIDVCHQWVPSRWRGRSQKFSKIGRGA